MSNQHAAVRSTESKGECPSELSQIPDSLRIKKPYSFSILEASTDEAGIATPLRQTPGESDRETKPHDPKDSTSKDGLPEILIPGRKRPTVSFLLPGETAERDEIANIWPDLVDMHKRNYNVAITSPKSHGLQSQTSVSNGGTMANQEVRQKNDEITIPDSGAESIPCEPSYRNSYPPERCAASTGCHLLKVDENDCDCQKRLKAARFESRIASLINGTPIDENSVALPQIEGMDVSMAFVVVDQKSTPCVPLSSGEGHKCELSAPLSASSKSGASIRSTSASAFNPPTPHPKLYGELSENDIRIRIAQVHDELRILNLALARGSQKVSDSEDSDAGTPETPEFYVGPDVFYLSSAGVSKVEFLELMS